MPNHVRQLRLNQLLSKAELARKAGVSTATITRVEDGMPCRPETRRKIVLALGFWLKERHLVFPADEEEPGTDRR